MAAPCTIFPFIQAFGPISKTVCEQGGLPASAFSTYSATVYGHNKASKPQLLQCVLSEAVLEEGETAPSWLLPLNMAMMLTILLQVFCFLAAPSRRRSACALEARGSFSVESLWTTLRLCFSWPRHLPSWSSSPWWVCHQPSHIQYPDRHVSAGHVAFPTIQPPDTQLTTNHNIQVHYSSIFIS